MTHTPTPKYAVYVNGVTGNIWLATTDADIACFGKDREGAHLIAEKLNSHDELVAALKEILPDYVLCVPDEAGNTDAWRKRLINKARAALAKAEAQ